jgi:hypothetical protein
MEDSKNKSVAQLYSAPCFSYLFTTPTYKSECKRSITRVSPRSVQAAKNDSQEYAYYFITDSRVIYLTKKQAERLQLSNCFPINQKTHE